MSNNDKAKRPIVYLYPKGSDHIRVRVGEEEFDWNLQSPYTREVGDWKVDLFLANPYSRRLATKSKASKEVWVFSKTIHLLGRTVDVAVGLYPKRFRNIEDALDETVDPADLAVTLLPIVSQKDETFIADLKTIVIKPQGHKPIAIVLSKEWDSLGLKRKVKVKEAPGFLWLQEDPDGTHIVKCTVVPEERSEEFKAMFRASALGKTVLIDISEDDYLEDEE